MKKIRKLIIFRKKFGKDINKGFKESLPLYKLALQLFLMQLIIILIQVFFIDFYNRYTDLFIWIRVFILLYALLKMLIFSYKIYTKSWKDLDELLQEYEGDLSKFDFSFPNDFIKGIYHAEGIRGNNIDFIKKLDSGVERLDSKQKRIAMIHIKNYNINTFNFFSGSYIFGVLTIFATLLPIFSFKTLKSSLSVFITFSIFALIVGSYIYRVNKKKCIFAKY